MDSRLYKEIGKSVERAKKNGGSLTDQNLLYVVKVASDISAKTGVDVETLITEGVIGMRKAEEVYDPKQNDNFVKYAAMSVRGYMLNAVNRQSSLVHIPANQMKGFKKGQEQNEDTKVEYTCIDASNYDTLGTVDNDAFNFDRDTILRNGLARLDENARIAVKMKLRMDEYEKVEKNNMKAIAEELEVPLVTANKIYKDAVAKLTKYCQAEYNS